MYITFNLYIKYLVMFLTFKNNFEINLTEVDLRTTKCAHVQFESLEEWWTHPESTTIKIRKISTHPTDSLGPLLN